MLCLFQESPMCLGYQIFKQSLIKIPSNFTNTILNGNIPTENNIITKTQPLDTSSVEEKSFKCATNFENMSRNSKYKSNTGNIGKISNTPEFEFGEPTVKIPRISSSLLDEEMNEIKSTELKCLKNDSPRLENRALSNDSGLYLDDYKYEQDIEEIVDDGDNENEEDNNNNDDEDDRLHILDLPDDKHEDMSQQLIIDTSDEGREEKLEDKKTKNKRKNKKSKHHKHHHRRHERKRGPPQATILNSPDTDIMKLKVKLNNIKPEIRYNKQSHKRWKKSPDTYFSTSSNCSESSILPSSPDTNGTCKADEESIQSQVFELSDESSATSSIKEDKIIKISKEEKEEIVKEPIACETNITIQSSANKDKLLQMRAFRPKNIAVVKPEENDKTSAIPFKNDDNDDNNNSEVCLPILKVNSPKTGSGIVHPASSSSITVSKITAAEKLLMEQEKKINNSNNNAKPSLEITLVTEPLKMMAGPVPTTSLCIPNQHKNNQLSHRMIKPVPPLYHLAVRSNEVNRSKAPSIQPYMRQMPLSPSQSGSTQSNTYMSNLKKKVNDGITAIKPDGMKQSVTISLSGNLNSKDSSSAINLSNKPLFSHSIANLTSSEPSKLHVKSNEITPPTNNYNPISNISSLTENVNLHKYLAANIPYKRHMIGYPIISTIQNNDRISCPSILHKPQAVTYPITNKISKTTNIPPLNEIRLGPASTLEVLPKPRQNQSVRNIPNPSHVRRKYNPYSTITVNPVTSQTTSESIEVSMMRHLASTSCSLSNYKEVVSKCSPVIPKSCMEHSNIMITK